MAENNNNSIRLNKYISDCGIASRRQADRLIEEGRVRVNGAAAETGMRISDTDTVELDGKIITPVEKEVIIAVNKPVGYVCTEARFKGEKTLTQLVKLPYRVFSVGRLDKDSEGLILMTNNGALAGEISKGSGSHEKEYEVTVDNTVSSIFLNSLRNGVSIEIDGRIFTTKPCVVRKTGAQSFNIILTQGMNRQIRRMCQALGYRVRYLKRVRVMNVRLGDLPSGEFRNLTDEEIRLLRKSL